MKKIIVIAWIFMFISIAGNAQDETLAGPGPCNAGPVAGNWTVPCGVTEITVEVYGAGGGAGGGGGGSDGGNCGTAGGGGGGGGGYTTLTFNVTPGTTFSYSVGAGGCGGGNGSNSSDGDPGNNGGNSSFTGSGVNLVANGGIRGTEGETCGIFGSGTGDSGDGGAGGTASGGSTNTTGASGSNGMDDFGGNGGDGAGPAGGTGGSSNGANGSVYGGGGAGGGDDPGGRGAAGGILITYVTTSTIPEPMISTTQPTCTADGFSTITNYDPTMTYIFTPAGPTVGAGGVISGTGSYMVVARDAGGCDSPPASFTNAAATGPPDEPAISTAPATCTADGIGTITNYNAALTYIFTPAGPSAGAGGVINGMVADTSYMVAADDGNCTSAQSAPFSIGAQLPAPAQPDVDTTSATCTSDGTGTIVNYNATLTYTFTPTGPAAGAGGVITGMATETSYTVEANDGSCPSPISDPFGIDSALGAPDVPDIITTQPTCTADGISTITNYDPALTYIFTPNGPVAGAGGAISGMVTDTSYMVAADDGNCTSAQSAPFSIGAQLPAPAQPDVDTTAATCTSDGTGTIVNYNATLTYTFTPTGPAAGAGGVITGMATETSYTVEADDGSCPSPISDPFGIDSAKGAPQVPDITTIPPTCTADGISTITNYDPALTYNFTPAGPSVGAGGAISGMVTDTSYMVAADDGNCTSAQSTSFSNNAQLPVPVASISGSLNYCTGGNTMLTASGGAGYTWTDAGGNNIGNGASVTVTQGTYTVEVINTDGCADTAFATVTEVLSLSVEIDGELSYCSGDDTRLTASGGTSYSWSNGDTTESVNVTEGTYSVTATDAGCSGTASAVVSELEISPLDLGNDITACEDSSVVIDAGNGYDKYRWNGGEITQTVEPNISGEYSVTVSDENDCSVSASVNVEFSQCTENNIYIPRAFSPNGDGHNDFFRILGIEDFNLDLFQVFNRWGEIVFETADPNDSWDGSHKDEFVDIGAYTYFVRGRFNDGERLEKSGSVTVVR